MSEIDAIVQRYQRLEYLANAAILVAVLSLCWLIWEFTALPGAGFLIMALGVGLLVRLVNTDGQTEFVTDKSPESVRSEFLGPKPPTMALTWGRATEVTETDDGYKYTVSPFGRSHVARYETADTEDGLTITTTYDGDHYATQEISIRREDGHTVVSVSGSTKKLRTTEYLLTLLQDIYGRKSMAQLGYEVL